MTGSPKRSALLSILIHGAAIALVVLATTGNSPLIEKALVVAHDAVFLPPRPGPGGGGGQGDKTPASRGILPPRSTHEFVAPIKRIVNPEPLLPVAPTILGPEDAAPPVINIALLGDPHGIPGPASGGPGSKGGIGGGTEGGIGDHKGPGYGGEDGFGATGSGHITGSVSAPVLLWKTEPAYSEEARKAKIQGTVVLYIEIDPRGQAQNIRVRQSIGFGLDERAIESVGHWRFRPAYRNGKPVPAAALVEVNFRLL